MLTLFTFTKSRFYLKAFRETHGQSLHFDKNKNTVKIKQMSKHLETMILDNREHYYICNDIEVFNVLKGLYIEDSSKVTASAIKIYSNSRLLYGSRWGTLPGLNKDNLIKAISKVKSNLSNKDE